MQKYWSPIGVFSYHSGIKLKSNNSVITGKSPNVFQQDTS